MKIVRFEGGLGNQMFQYALYLALCDTSSHEQVMADCTYYGHKKAHNGFELERVFGIKIPRATTGMMLRLTWPDNFMRPLRKLFYRGGRHAEITEDEYGTFIPALNESRDMFLRGYWQNPAYFRHIGNRIHEAFRFRMHVNAPTERLLEALGRETASVSLHVRRGDYLKFPLYRDICTPAYYRSAITYVTAQLPEAVFYIFSDDIAWCRENISPMLGGHRHEFVDFNHGEESPLDMLLMSHCCHNIIANSSFSWWGAWLNRTPGQIVCAPRRWVNRPMASRIQPESWILF